MAVIDSYSHLLSVDRGYLLRDDLSLRAKGLLSFMLAQPSHWRGEIHEFPDQTGESVEDITEAFQELMAHKYVIRVVNEDKGIDHHISDTPQLTDEDVFGEGDEEEWE